MLKSPKGEEESKSAYLVSLIPSVGFLGFTDQLKVLLFDKNIDEAAIPYEIQIWFQLVLASKENPEKISILLQNFSKYFQRIQHSQFDRRLLSSLLVRFHICLYDRKALNDYKIIKNIYASMYDEYYYLDEISINYSTEICTLIEIYIIHNERECINELWKFLLSLLEKNDHIEILRNVTGIYRYIVRYCIQHNSIEDIQLHLDCLYEIYFNHKSKATRELFCWALYATENEIDQYKKNNKKNQRVLKAIRKKSCKYVDELIAVQPNSLSIREAYSIVKGNYYWLYTSEISLRKLQDELHQIEKWAKDSESTYLIMEAYATLNRIALKREYRNDFDQKRLLNEMLWADRIRNSKQVKIKMVRRLERVK